MRNWLIMLAAVILLSGCAKPPHQELDATEYMVSHARALQAADYAPTEFQAAVSALEDAREALKNTDYGDARDSLEFALQHARRAATLTEERKLRQAEETERLAREEAARKAAEQKLKAEQQVRQAEPAKVTPPKPTAPRRPEPVPQVSSYQVGPGETLWTISALPQVYNDGLLWPLLYQANRDQIKDPRQIFPGQSLSIRRDTTPEELELARQKARESDIFPLRPRTGDKPLQNQ